MKLRKALPALALVALLSGTTSVALADRPPRDGGSSQQQQQDQDQRQSVFPGVVDEVPGLSQSDSESSSSQTSDRNSQSQEQSQSQSQCLICINNGS